MEQACYISVLIFIGLAYLVTEKIKNSFKRWFWFINLSMIFIFVYIFILGLYLLWYPPSGLDVYPSKIMSEIWGRILGYVVLPINLVYLYFYLKKKIKKYNPTVL